MERIRIINLSYIGMSKKADFPAEYDLARAYAGRVNIPKFLSTLYPWFSEADREEWGWLYLVRSYRVRVLSDADMQSDPTLLGLHEAQARVPSDPTPFHSLDADSDAIERHRLQKTHVNKKTVRVQLPKRLFRGIGLSAFGHGDVVVAVHELGCIEIWHPARFDAAFGP